MKKVNFGYIFLTELIVIDFLFKCHNNYFGFLIIALSVLSAIMVVYLKVLLNQKKFFNLFILAVSLYIGIDFVLHMGFPVGIIFSTILCMILLFLKMLFINKNKSFKLSNNFAFCSSWAIQFMWIFANFTNITLMTWLFGAILSIFLYEFAIY